MILPPQIFEADQSNLFEESTIFTSALTFSLGCATTLLPCSHTLPISILLCNAATQTLTLLKEYVLQELQEEGCSKGGTPNALWLGGLTYHPVYYVKIYNSLIGAAHLCHLYRQGRPPLSSTLLQPTDPISGGDRSEEQQACAALFTQLSEVVTKAKWLIIQLRNRYGDEDPCQASSNEDSQRVSCMIHPSIISLLVEICGPSMSQSLDADSSLCSIL